jgi:acyl transferase domain-containing protein/NAD(P)-dependent dehydrogenase (short-subunit alcohol dehydrogenase family)
MFPMADDLARFWSNIRNRMDAITDVPPTHWRPDDYWDGDPQAADRTYARRGGFLTPVDFPLLDFGIAPHAVEATDTTQLLGLLVARQALSDAGYGPDRDFSRDRVSVVLGVTGTLELVIPLGARLGHPIWRRALREEGVDGATAENVVRRISQSYVGWQESSFPGLLGNVAAGRIANRLDLGGTNCVVDAACASSLGAVNLAMLELAAGRCDIALSGGLDTFNDIFMYMCFSKTPALSPSGDARPFDAAADGTALGEGLGILVLKRLDDARRDGDRIYAVIRSMGSSSDGRGQAVYAPSAAGQVKALRQAYDLAGVSPGSIELVEAHGTGTRVGDAIELEALEQVYGDANSGSPWCALGSIKSQVGHTKAAAGAAGLIKAALALHHKVLPPTIKVSQPIAPLASGNSPFYLNTESRPWLPRRDHPRRAAVSAFGFGGSNFHCLLEEAEAEPAAIDWGGDVQILAYSDDDPGRLAAGLPRWTGEVAWQAVRQEAARGRAAFRHAHRYRLLMVARRCGTEPSRLIEEAASRLSSLAAGHGESPGTRRPGRTGRAASDSRAILVGTGPARGSLALLFPGQGSQSVGMFRDLACRFPRMQAALALWNDAAGPGDDRLSDRIYPRSCFREDDRRRQHEALRDTRFAQPAIGAVSLGLLHILEDFGVRPALVGGHSFGELTALCAAGRIDAQTLALLSLRRGALMAGCAGSGDPGAMLAVFAPIDQVASLIRQHGLDVVIANKNAPGQYVLSGPIAEIERAAGLFGGEHINSSKLAVSAAFHSRFVAHAQAGFQESLAAVDLKPGMMPVFANTTGSLYPDDAESARELLAGQLSQPVEFVAQVEAMYRMEARTFLEAGPGARLTGLVRSILDGREHEAIAVDASPSEGDDGNLAGLALALANLSALGYPVDLKRWDDGYQVPASVPASTRKHLTVKVCGAHPAPARVRDRIPDHQPEGGPDDVANLPAIVPRARTSTLAPEPRISTPTAEVGNSQGSHHVGENDSLERTMNPPEHDHHSGSNGRASSLASGSRPAVPGPAPEASGAAIPVVPPSHHADLAQAIRQTQENLVALQRLAEQTAQLHRQFLEGQAATQHTFQALLEHQQRLTSAVLGRGGRQEASPQEPLPLAVLPSRITPVSAPRQAPIAGERPPEAVNGSASFPVAAAATPAPTVAVAEVLLQVVAEKTGYPVEMLELDMQLDDDLGIDSIKRVEILSALQDRLPEAPAVKPEHLGSLRTLRQIADFLAQQPAGQEAALPPSGVTIHASRNGDVYRPAAACTASAPALGVAEVLLQVVAEKTGYPVEMLELDMQLDDDLGIDSIKRVEILSALQDRLPEAPAVKPEHLGALRTLRQIADFLAQQPAGQEAALPRTGATAPAGRNGEVHRPAAACSTPAPAVVVADVLLQVVAEKTGYPVEMLELDMQLDDDLGIDSIKRVEILSALQDRLPEAPAVKPEHLGALRTLRQIIDFLGHEPDLPEPETQVECRSVPAEPEAAAELPLNSIKGVEPLPTVAVAAAGALERLVPRVIPLAAPDRREAAAITPGSEIWLVGDGSPLTDAIRQRLIGRGHRVRLIGPAESTPPEPSEHVAGLIILAPPMAQQTALVKYAFRLVRTGGPSLRLHGARGGSALLTVSRMDGAFGLGGLADEIDPASGALAGLLKTARQEWPEVHCKAVDLDAAFQTLEFAAERIVAEMLRRGPAEVGLTESATYQVELVALPAHPVPGARPDRRQDPLLRAGEVIVISGGARGITAEVALGLAASLRPRLVLLGRTPQPEAEPDWLAPLETDATIRRAIRDHAGRSCSPQELSEQLRLIQSQREIRHNLQRIAAAGADVTYHAIDVRNRDAVKGLLEGVCTRSGPVRGLIHGAGVLADRRIEDLTDAQFAHVFDTKVEGLLSLFDAIDPRQLQFLTLFSSSTARYGRVGQAAYAAANEWLNKWAQRMARRLSACRVVAFNWGPWDGGMVTGALKPMFEREGLGLIAPADGARLLVDEIHSSGKRPVEVVVLASPAHSASASFVAAIPAPEGGGEGASSRTASSQPHRSNGKMEPVFERRIDLGSLPVIRSHVIDGHAVLPMALILEWLAEGALHRHPGLVAAGVENLRLFKGVVLRDHRPSAVSIRVGKGQRRGESLVVPVEMRGVLESGREITHARGEVIVADRHSPGERLVAEAELLPLAADREEIYRRVLFHGPAMQAIQQVEGCDDRTIAAWVSTSPPPASWMERPFRQTWLTDPLAIDAAFQLLVLWTRERLGSSSLPTGVGAYRQFRKAFPAEGVRVLAAVRQHSGHRAVADIEFLDTHGHLVARIESYECVIDASLNQAFRRNRLSQLEIASS